MINDVSLDSVLAHQKELRDLAEQGALAKIASKSQQRKRKRKPIADKFVLGILVLFRLG